MDQVETLFDILGKINYPCLVEKQEGIWFIRDNVIYWNEDDNEDDLMNEEGETYSGYMPEGYKVFGDYLVVNIDTQTSTLVTTFFKMDKEIKNG